MMEVNFKNILDKVEAELPKRGLKDVQHIAADVWLCASGLQKSVRRGDERLAASCALTLAHQDRKRCWRRLMTIALEDIGAANLELVLETIVAYQSPMFRRACGDITVAAHLARKMAASVKSRLSTEMIFLTDLAGDMAKARKAAERASSRKLGAIVLDTSQEPSHRFLSLWALAGSKLYSAKGFSRVGDIQATEKILRMLPVCGSLTQACITLLPAVSHPLALFMPLAYTVIEQEKASLRVEKERPASSEIFEGIPAFFADPLYTRTGGTALRKLQKAVPALRTYSQPQLGESLFFLCGENIDRRLTSDSLEQLRQSSIGALMCHLGLDQHEYAVLGRLLKKHWGLWNSLRVQEIERSLYGQKDLFSVKE